MVSDRGDRTGVTYGKVIDICCFFYRIISKSVDGSVDRDRMNLGAGKCVVINVIDGSSDSKCKVEEVWCIGKCVFPNFIHLAYDSNTLDFGIFKCIVFNGFQRNRQSIGKFRFFLGYPSVSGINFRGFRYRYIDGTGFNFTRDWLCNNFLDFGIRITFYIFYR